MCRTCIRGRIFQLTVSNPLPVKILSVVAATLPPFRCKSHISSLRVSCGNICARWSSCTGSTVWVPVLPLCELLSFCEDVRDEKNHRKTKNETTAKVMSEGMLTEGSESAIDEGIWGYVKPQQYLSAWSAAATSAQRKLRGDKKESRAEVSPQDKNIKNNGSPQVETKKSD